MAQQALVVRFRLEEPTLAGRPGGDPNTVWSYPYIPGSVFRGAVLARTGFTGTVFDRLLGDTGGTWLNAYPGVNRANKWIRTLPAPLIWRQSKETGLFVPSKPGIEAKEDTRPLSGFAAVTEKETFAVDDPAFTLTLHHDRDRVLGRPTRDSGSIFRYAALASDQVFIAAVLGDKIVLDAVATILKSGDIRLGKARRGYGGVDILDASVQAEWQEYPSNSAPSASFAMSLLSAGLFRNSDGTPSLAPDATELSKLLEVDTQIAGQTVSPTSIGGFNRKWNLPLPTVRAAAPGSTYAITCDQAPSQRALKALLTQGLGERRNEGFGRIAIGLRTPSDCNRAKLPVVVREHDTPPTAIDPETSKLIERLKKRASRPGEAAHA